MVGSHYKAKERGPNVYFYAFGHSALFLDCPAIVLYYKFAFANGHTIV